MCDAELLSPPPGNETQLQLQLLRLSGLAKPFLLVDVKHIVTGANHTCRTQRDVFGNGLYVKTLQV